MSRRATTQHQLEQVFEPRQAAVLAEVLEAASAQLVSASDFSELKDAVGQVAQAVERLALAQQRTEAWVAALAEAQERTDQRVGELAQAMQQLVQAQARTEEQVAALAQVQARTVEWLGELDSTAKRLVERTQRLTDRVGSLDGRMLELRYRERAGAYFGPLLRRLRVVAPHTLEDVLEAALSPEDVQEVLRLDLLATGQPRRPRSDADVWLAVEVSGVVDREDVTRARRRASLLRRAGYRAIPTVAGERLTAHAEGEARDKPLLVVLDGHALHWEESLADLADLGL